MFQVSCRIRNISIISVLFLTFSNIWLTVRLLQSSQECSDKGLGNVNNVELVLAKPKEEINRRVKEMVVMTADETSDQSDNLVFNISLKLGRWDGQHLFKMFDHVVIGLNFTNLSDSFSVTLATQSSLEKLHSIVQVAHQWSGPVSAAVYAAGDDELFLLSWYISFLRNCFTYIRERVSFHLAVPFVKLPTGKTPNNLRMLREKTYDCKKPEGVLKEILKLRTSENVKWRTKNAYPQNHLRNLARKNCQTYYVFLTDVDIIPSSKLAESLDMFLKSTRRKCVGKCAYVIPTYELDDRASFPKNKADLIRLSKKGLARPFHQKVFIYNQFATNFSKWENYTDKNQVDVTVSHNVTNFEFLYEPFYVSPDTVPQHDERFIGYGYTRNTQVYEMFVAGYKFEVLSPIFTIHWGLQVKKGRPSWRERQNSMNRKHFDVFKREVFARYYKDPLKMLR